MLAPGEQKTVQARILACAQEIAWRYVPRAEAEARRGFDPDAATPEERARKACISAVTRAELRFGVVLRPKANRLAQVVDGFLSIARTVAWDSGAADAHGQLRATLTAKGRRIGDFDEMVAAHALALGATLVTDNVRHFSRVSGLKIENWIR